MGEQEEVTEDALLAPPPNVSTTSTSPGGVEPSSSAQDVALPATDTGDGGGDAVQDTEPLPEFDPRFRDPFQGLLYLGKVVKKFTWLGHTFILRTPTVEDILEMGMLHKPYWQTLADIKAYQTLMVAATLESIDGQPLPVPLSDEVTELEAKFNYISKHWYPWTLDKLYDEYKTLDKSVEDTLEAMGKA